MVLNMDCENFCDLVIYVAREVFNESEYKYLGKTRLNKLIVIVFQELGYPVDGFVWGYYKHGFYSPQVNEFLGKRAPAHDELNLGSINTPLSVNTPQDILIKIKRIISSYQNHFKKRRDSFRDWVYNEKTPINYRPFYGVHNELLSWLDNAINGNIDKEKLDELITDYYLSLKHVSEDTLYLFSDFTDLLEDLVLTSTKNTNDLKITRYFNQLKKLYLNKISRLLVPYEESLSGDEKEVQKELERFAKKKKIISKEVRKELDEIYDSLESKGLLPSFAQILGDLKETVQKYPNAKSVDEIIQEISR